MLSNESYLPTDASSFYLHGVPILAAFTGSHPRVPHAPRDTPEKLNYVGMAQVARFMAAMTASLAQRPDPPDYQSQPAPARGPARSNLRVYLGTIPDYAAEVHGVKLSGVVKDGPAARAGLQPGDVIVELAGRKLDNIYDYMYALEGLKSGVQAPLTILRDGHACPWKSPPRPATSRHFGLRRFIAALSGATPREGRTKKHVPPLLSLRKAMPRDVGQRLLTCSGTVTCRGTVSAAANWRAGQAPRVLSWIEKCFRLRHSHQRPALVDHGRFLAASGGQGTGANGLQ